MATRSFSQAHNVYWLTNRIYRLFVYKGYMDDVSKTKIDLFQKQYDIPIHVWDDTKLKELEIL